MYCLSRYLRQRKHQVSFKDFTTCRLIGSYVGSSATLSSFNTFSFLPDLANRYVVSAFIGVDLLWSEKYCRVQTAL